MSHPACDKSGGIFHVPLIPSHFIGQSSHARPTNPMPIPSKKYLRFMLYISSIFLVSPPLSVGHPAPPSTPLVRPRTAVCSRGARARRERSGSGAPADRYSGGHRAAAAHAGTSAAHTAHAAGELATSSHSPPANPARCTTRCGLLHSAGEPAPLRSRRCCTTRCGTLHSAPPQLPFTQPGCPAQKSRQPSRGQCA